MKVALREMEEEIGANVDADFNSNPQIEIHKAVAGGGWWQGTISNAVSFPEAVVMFTEKSSSRLEARFKDLVSHAVNAVPQHKVDKN